MRSNSRIRHAVRVTAMAVAVAGLVAAAQSTARAAEKPATSAASVEVTPATELVDGQTVQVAVTGLWPQSPAFAGQCAFPGDVVVCDPNGMVEFATDAAGNGSTTFAVRKTFLGYSDSTGEPWGDVDCTAVPCAVVATDGLTFGSALISFR